jgi:ATP-dependent DNA helicase RecQ
LLRPADKRTKPKRTAAVSTLASADVPLFQSLRVLRRDQAHQRQIPAYLVFGDAVLREMARLRPRTIDALRQVKGVGDKKCADYGTLFVEHIRRFCDAE